MGVAAETDAEVADALAAADERPWLALLPSSHVTRPGVRPSSSMSSTATTSL
jgi:hypothetical protein